MGREEEEDEDMDVRTLPHALRMELAIQLLIETMHQCAELLKGTGQTSLSGSSGDGTTFVALTLNTEKTNALRAALDSILTPLEASVEKEKLYVRNEQLRARIAELEAHIKTLSENGEEPEA